MASRLARGFDLASGILVGLARPLGFPPPPLSPPPRRILVLKPDHLGDLVMALPSLNRLREAFPEAEIDLYAKAATAPLLRAQPGIDRVEEANLPWCCHGFEVAWGYRELWDFVGVLRSRRYDLAICLQENPRNALLLFLAGIPRRIGFAPRGGRPLWSDCPEGPHPEEHSLDSQFRLLDSLDIPATSRLPRLQLPEADRQAGRELARSYLEPGEEGFVLLNVGAGHPAKALQPSQLQDLVRLLPEALGMPILLVGGPREQDRVAALREVDPLRARSLGVLELRVFAGLLAEATLVIAHDSGPGHVAAALGTPVLSLFGPSDPDRWAPRGERVRVVRRVACETPCGQDRPVLECQCFRELPAEEIVQAARRFLDQLSNL